MYVHATQKNLCKSFMEMPKLTKKLSNLINSSLNMGTNKFSTSIKLQNREITSLFFLPSLSQIPLKKGFLLIHCRPIYISPLCWEVAGARHHPMLPYLQSEGISAPIKPSIPRSSSFPVLVPALFWAP